MNRFLATWVPVFSGLLLCGALGLGGYFTLLYSRLPKNAEGAPRAALPEASTSPAIAADAWQVVRPSGRPPVAGGPLAERFRLAGTFFLYAEGGVGNDGARRRAILDDLNAKTQLLVQEEQVVDGYAVTRIETDRIRLMRDGTEYELTLSFTAVAGAPAATAGGPSEQPSSMEEMPALESSRFGKRVGENRWVMKREELLRYYTELLDDPERIANVYASMKPKYEENEIGGYMLEAEGEQEFFKAIGLQEGDVIRRVNSMRMVSQRRAEYFMAEFMKNRVSALVFDIERGGKPEKMIYLIR